eukprot:c3664_g1_i2.p1 GENE.c3664_g1_i2~~c3664_g1_i2.p1  ORF type:complete len:225 (+),score=32.70 c3664_g1_i2:214-888(+)
MPETLRTGSFQVGRNLFLAEGIRGLYRGGLPLFLGGALMRSAQFGVYENTLSVLQERTPQKRFLGFLDYQVVLAGFAGGLGRGIAESPFEFIKVRRQVEQTVTFRALLRGLDVTMFRNAFLFSSFVIYIDISKQMLDGKLGSFMTGGLCATLSWITIWPLDVVKSRVQSGNFPQSNLTILREVFARGEMFRGLLPGIMRSFFANGVSMVVYTHIRKEIEKFNEK